MSNIVFVEIERRKTIFSMMSSNNEFIINRHPDVPVEFSVVREFSTGKILGVVKQC